MKTDKTKEIETRNKNNNEKPSGNNFASAAKHTKKLMSLTMGD